MLTGQEKGVLGVGTPVVGFGRARCTHTLTRTSVVASAARRSQRFARHKQSRLKPNPR